jgi:hypothetical protein
MNNDIFDFEVPPPLHKFTGDNIIAPENLILSGQEPVKIITKEQYRHAKKELASLEKTLIKAGVDDWLAEFTRLKTEHTQYKVEWLSLKKQAQAGGITSDLIERGQIVRQNQASLYVDAKEIVTRLEPYRAKIARRAGLRQRIKEYETWLIDEKIREKLTREMAEEANYYAKLIRTHWSRMGFVHRYTKGKKTITLVPTFERIIATPDTIQFKIAISRRGLVPGSVVNVLPYGIEAIELVSERVINELTGACERIFASPHIQYSFGYLNGIWLILYRMGLTDGLLNFVSYQNVISRYDADRQHRFPLPLGVKVGRHINWVELVQHPHILVTGQTGSGKSKAIDMIISTLITHHTPREIRLILVDLKEGIELGKFASAPHTMGFVNDDLGKTARVLAQLEEERKRRVREIKRIPGVVDVDQYNALVPENMRIPRIIVFFDEFGMVATNKQWKNIIYDLVIQLVQLGRSSAIHLVIGAQTPFSDIVPSAIKAQITLAITGRQRGLGPALATSGNRDSSDLDKIPGRMLCDDGMDSYPVQMPYISPEEIKQAVADSQIHEKPAFVLPELSYDLDDTAPYSPIYMPVDEDRIARIALEEFDGVMARDKIWQWLNEQGEKISKVQVNVIINAIRKKSSITVGGVDYLIRPHGKGHRIESLSESPGESPQYDTANSELSDIQTNLGG